MSFEVDKRIVKKFEGENLRLEYSSLLNQTNQFIFRQESDDYSIIVPRKPRYSENECIWSLVHEFGHYLVRTDKEIDEFSMEQQEIEKLSWQRGKALLIELDLPASEGVDTYEAFAERCIDSYKIAVNSSQDKVRLSKEKGNGNAIFAFLGCFAEISKGISSLFIGAVLGYALLMAFEQENAMQSLFILAIFIKILQITLSRIVGNRYNQSH